jgi:hypothetical protein
MTEKNQNNELNPTPDLEDAELEDVSGVSSFLGNNGSIQSCIG